MKKLHLFLPLVLATAVWACNPNDTKPENNGVVTPGEDVVPETFEREMAVCEIGYYDYNQYTRNHNWQVRLMDKPSTSTGLQEGNNYGFDIYGKSYNNALTNPMPNDGTYTLSRDLTVAGTMGFQYSYYYVVTADNTRTEINFTSGTLTVSHDPETDEYTFTADVTDEDGNIHKVTYTGTYTLFDGR